MWNRNLSLFAAVASVGHIAGVGILSNIRQILKNNKLLLFSEIIQYLSFSRSLGSTGNIISL